MRRFSSVVWSFTRDLVSRQEYIALSYIVVLLVANGMLAWMGDDPWMVTMAALLLPASFYVLMAALFRRPGMAIWLSFPFIFLGAFQIVLIKLFGGSVIAVDMFMNLFTTNATEAGELLNDLWPSIVLVIALYIPLLVLGVHSLRLKARLSPGFRRGLFGVWGVLLLLGIAFAVPSYLKYPNFGIRYQVFPANAIYNIKLTIDKWGKSLRYPETSAGFTFDAQRHKQTQSREVYVLVIGEASRGMSWSMFGYDRETTPRLAQREGVVGFSNVLTQSNATHKSVPLILSPVSAENIEEIYRQKSSITAFKEAGFRTVFISNQVPNRSLIDYFSAEADLRLDISPQGQLYSDNRPDGEMLPLLRTELEADTTDLLVVIHTYGSHFNYQKRYPSGFGPYQPDVIPSISKENQQRMVNAYDNSIYYTDRVMDELISLLEESDATSALLYCSDHGEDLMDDRREKFLHASPTPTAYQLHVGCFVWLSPHYRQLWPQRLGLAREHSHQPASTANVFHTLVEMAGITTPYFDPSYSLVGERYRPHTRMYLTDHDKAVDLYHAGLTPADLELLRPLLGQ